MKTTSRTEKKNYAFDYAPRCGARTKSNNGNPCRCPAIKGKYRCRVHGGTSPGAPLHNLNALKHGNTTTTAKAFRKEVKQTIRFNAELFNKLSELGY